MASQWLRANHLSRVIRQFLPSLGPALLISVSYVDPGKWAAIIDGGARFGMDMLTPMICFSIIAMIYHYLAIRITLITRKDLAQICSQEYDKWICILLRVQTLISVVASDLTMILGIAHGLRHLFGMDLRCCVCLTTLDALLYPLFSTVLERHSANVFRILLSGFLVLLCYFGVGVFTSQPEEQQSMDGRLLRGKNAYALMSILGASIVPHNFYLHSSIVLQQQVVPGTSVGTLCQNHLLSIFFVFGGISLVNYALINSASYVFYNLGLVPFTISDALSLTEQVFRGPVAPLPFLLILFVGNQITALKWNVHGQVISHDLLGVDIPSWTIRIFSIIPAFFCVCSYGGEGVYQLLIFPQVIIAVLLPSSVIPLFRVASSQALMGDHKISPISEYLAIGSIMVILGPHIKLVGEMLIGYSHMFDKFRLSMASSSSSPYIVLVTVCLLCFMLLLAATLLNSSTRVGGQMGSRDVQNIEPETCEQREEISEPMCDLLETMIADVCDDEMDSAKTVEVATTESVGKTMHSADLPTPREDDNSRLGGLGRATRLQLAAVLDDFWEQLYDLHGQPRCGVKRNYTRMLNTYIQDCQRGSLTSSERPSYDVYSMSTDTKKYHRLLDISEVFGAYRGAYMSENSTQWDNSSTGSGSNSLTKETSNPVDPEATILQSFRCCILNLLRLEGSDWLFRQNDGVDEDLIDRVAARERCLYEAETRKMIRGIESGDPLHLYTERKSGTSSKNDEVAMANILVSTVPYCGDGCVWTTDLLASFGIWCIHRVLELSLTEGRPELWGKYTYVLNRLQGIVDQAFSEPRTPMPPCLCLQLSAAHQQQRSSPPSNSMLPLASEPGRGKCTDASTLLDLIKAVEIVISGRKGRSGTAAAKAFQKGKDNLGSVLRRYKRRLANYKN